MAGTESAEVRPRDVAAYRRAVPDGAVRPVPKTAPIPLPGVTAGRRFNRFLLHGAIAVGVWLLVLAALGASGAGRAVTGVGTALAGLALMAVVMADLGRVGNRALEELSHGYTTLTLEFGAFWIGALRRWPRSGHRAPWDYGGTWVLDNAGAVISAPDPDKDAPGLYPSPNRDGALELWTGLVWSGNYR